MQLTRSRPRKVVKYIVKTVHVTSVVQRNFIKLQEYFFVCKENKNNDFIQQFPVFRVGLQ